MIGLNSEELEKALCSRTMKTAKEEVVTTLNFTQVRALWEGADFEWETQSALASHRTEGSFICAPCYPLCILGRTPY